MRYFGIVAAFVFLAWFAYGGGEVILPILDRLDDERHWADYLKACQPDEMRTKQFLSGQERQAGTLNLTTGQLVGLPAPVITEYGPFWSRIRMIFHTLNYPSSWSDKPYPPEKLERIKSLLAALPAPVSNSADYHSQFHLAFFQGGSLRVYHYRKDDARKTLAPLFDLLGFTLINDWDR